MSVISSAHFNLIRARKELQKSFREEDWDALRDWDTKLGDCLSHALDDPQRDTSALVNEMESVLKLYAEIVAQLPEQASAETKILRAVPRPKRVQLDDA
ncbi:hypothetical protein [Teredinibacter turnerae]|uniref:hypothetical protein n=1 Tax=Teredinibacter turnerae TaxID=2426 RepID=UPI00036E5C72|nr:hypothetical protein [Teredinibacter turnerae]